MTVKEAIKLLKYNSNVIHKTINGEADPNEVEALDMAIKALEQGDALEKIRAEIEEQVLESLSDGGDDWFAAEKVNECLEIIDKYKTESEDKE